MGPPPSHDGIIFGGGGVFEKAKEPITEYGNDTSAHNISRISREFGCEGRRVGGRLKG